MPDLIKMFLGFLVGFFLYESLNALPGGNDFDVGAAVLDSAVTAVIATAIVAAVLRFRKRKASHPDAPV